MYELFQESEGLVSFVEITVSQNSKYPIISIVSHFKVLGYENDKQINYSEIQLNNIIDN